MCRMLLFLAQIGAVNLVVVLVGEAADGKPEQEQTFPCPGCDCPLEWKAEEQRECAPGPHGLCGECGGPMEDLGASLASFGVFFVGLVMSTGGVLLWSLWQRNQLFSFWVLGLLALGVGVSLMEYGIRESSHGV